MPFILVDHVRKRRYYDPGGGHEIAALDMEAADVGTERVLRIDHALDDLAKVDARKARVVEIRMFAGVSVDERARLLCVSAETIGRGWKFARVILFPGGFAPPAPPTRSLAGPPSAPVRSRGSLASLARATRVRLPCELTT